MNISISKKLLMCACLVPCLYGAAYPLESSVPYGAGLESLGGAIVALPCEESVFTNPAFLAVLDRKSLLLSGTQDIEDKKNFQFLGILPNQKGGLAAGYSRSSVDNIELRDELNRDLGTAQFYSQKFNLASGFHLNKIIGFGGGLSLESFGLNGDNYKTNALFDLGLFGYFPQFNAGISMLRWGENNNSQVRFGVGRAGKASFAVESVWPVRYDPYGNFSFSYQLHEKFTAQLAYHTGPQDIKRLGFVSGFGFGFRINHKQFSFDYAFLPLGDIGISHKFSIVFRAGKKVKRSWQLNPIHTDQSAQFRTNRRYLNLTKSLIRTGALSPDIAKSIDELYPSLGQPVPEQPLPTQNVRVSADAQCPQATPELYSGELGSLEAAQDEYNQRLSLLNLELNQFHVQKFDPYLYAEIQSEIEESKKQIENTSNPISGFRNLGKAENSLLKAHSQRSQELISRETPPENEAAWKMLVEDSISFFSLLSREIKVTEKKDAVVFELENVSCLGSGRFSGQSGTILSQVSKFLKKYREYPTLIDVSGDQEGSTCAESILTFFYNERLDTKLMKTRNSIGEPSTKIFILKNRVEPRVSNEPLKTDNQNQSEIARKMTIFFDRGEVEVPIEYQGLLTDFGNRIKYKKSLSIVVLGYTDILGRKEYRGQLANCRAQKVVEILVGAGIDHHAITINSSPDQWVTDNETPLSRSRNRRVDIMIRYFDPQGD